MNDSTSSLNSYVDSSSTTSGSIILNPTYSLGPTIDLSHDMSISGYISNNSMLSNATIGYNNSKFNVQITDKMNQKGDLQKVYINPNGSVVKFEHIIPKIIDIKVFNNRVVKVTFSDNTFTKSVCDKDDIFNFEYGLMICILKKMNGNTDFLKILKYALRRDKEIRKNIEVDKDLKEEKEKIILRRKAKYARKKARREERRSKNTK